MGWYSDECLQIAHQFEFDYKNNVYSRYLNQTATDIWILNKKKECLLSMKHIVKLMDREVRELEKKLAWEDSEELKELKEANLIKKKRNSR